MGHYPIPTKDGDLTAADQQGRPLISTDLFSAMLIRMSAEKLLKQALHRQSSVIRIK